MHKFDVRYSFDNYYEYYKFALIKQRILRDLIFSVLFIGIAIYWWVDAGEATEGNVLPIFALVMGVVFPLMNLLTFPMLKKQIRSKQSEIDRTHIVVTFEEDEIIYENQSEPAKPVVNEEKVEVKEEVKEEQPAEEVVEVKEEPAEEVVEVKEEQPVEEVKSEEGERVFKLKYANFLQVKETEGLFLFFLDRQTVIILPKTTYVGGEDFAEFKNFILSKINPKRVKFLKK